MMKLPGIKHNPRENEMMSSLAVFGSHYKISLLKRRPIILSMMISKSVSQKALK